jgi:hypothetical protein
MQDSRALKARALYPAYSRTHATLLLPLTATEAKVVGPSTASLNMNKSSSSEKRKGLFRRRERI